MTGEARVFLGQSRESSLRSRRDSVSLVQQALVADPADALAHATMGFYLAGERNQRNLDAMCQCVEKSRECLNNQDTQAVHYCNALAALSKGKVTEMVFHLEQQLLRDPTDVNALKMCQGELFWLGEMQWSASISEAVAPAWSESREYYSDYLAMRAFDLEETGHYAEAEKLGRESVEINPSDVWGAHAVAHVMYMQGRARQGAKWLDSLAEGGHWDGLGQMVLHLWWHRALFHLINDEQEAALQVYDDYLRNFEIDMVAALPDLYLDLQNAVSLLIRLELMGVSVGDRWSTLDDICVQRSTDMSNAFSCAHYIAVLAANDRFDRAQSMIELMSGIGLSEVSAAGSYTNASIPASIAAIAHRKKDYREVIKVLMPARFQLVQMGASHAQREVFLLLLADALQREGETDMLQRLSLDLQETGFSEIMANRILR